MENLKTVDIQPILKYIQKITGIQLDESKGYLLETRLGRLLKEFNCSSFFDLYQKAKTDRSGSIEQKIIDEITTTETSFFRDNAPFQMLQYKILPDLIDRKKAASMGISPLHIRIWSAGCSTGQELYSIAMVLKEMLGEMGGYQFLLLGTDISNRAIAQASRGEYSQFEIQRGMLPNKLQKYFTFNGSRWRINEDIRVMVTFKKVNLLNPFNNLGLFDIIFCRNVAVYFSLEDRRSLFERVEKSLDDEGYLIIGSTETLTNIYPRFEPKRYLRSVFYQLKK